MSKVVLVAHTQINRKALADIGYRTHEEELPDGRFKLTETDADELAEAAGRLCYKSEHRPNPATDTNRTYLDHIHEVGHESVEAHASATFYIETSRSVLTELERHHFLDFSVVSQRYVNVVDKFPTLHTPPAFAEIDDPELIQDLVNHASDTSVLYHRTYDHLRGKGKQVKEAREASRAILPNSQSSPMYVTGSLRAWKHVIRLRTHPTADAEIQEVANKILDELRIIAPNTVSDL